eukprot:8627468-Pyramimonas_sp.AAC.1
MRSKLWSSKEATSSAASPMSWVTPPAKSPCDHGFMRHICAKPFWSFLKLNSPVVEWLNKGLMDNPQIWHFFGARKYLGGIEFASGVEW